MDQIQKNLEISGVSQITIGYDDSLGHTFEIFHSFDSMIGKPKDQYDKEKVKIFCTIDSNDKICSVNWRKGSSPCEVVPERSTYRASEKVSRPATSNQPLSNFAPDGTYCPNKLIVFPDSSYVYLNKRRFSAPYFQLKLNKNRSFTVDSHQSRNTNAIIDALKNYCREKSGCNEPGLYRKTAKSRLASYYENMERNMDRNIK